MLRRAIVPPELLVEMQALDDSAVQQLADERLETDRQQRDKLLRCRVQDVKQVLPGYQCPMEQWLLQTHQEAAEFKRAWAEGKKSFDDPLFHLLFYDVPVIQAALIRIQAFNAMRKLLQGGKVAFGTMQLVGLLKIHAQVGHEVVPQVLGSALAHQKEAVCPNPAFREALSAGQAKIWHNEYQMPLKALIEGICQAYLMDLDLEDAAQLLSDFKADDLPELPSSLSTKLMTRVLSAESQETQDAFIRRHPRYARQLERLKDGESYWQSDGSY